MTLTTMPPATPSAQDARRRASYTARRLRLGGHVVMTVADLDDLPETAISAAHGGAVIIDWVALLKLVGFDADESVVLVAGVHGVPRTKLAG